MKTLDEMIAVMQASKTKEIEARVLEGWSLIYPEWQLCPSPSWNWKYCDYRVKPQEPVKVWMSLCRCPVGDFWLPYHSKEACEKDKSDSIKLTSEFIQITPEIRERLGL